LTACPTISSFRNVASCVERTPDTTITAEVESGAVAAGDLRFTATVPPALREGFLTAPLHPRILNRRYLLNTNPCAPVAVL